MEAKTLTTLLPVSYPSLSPRSMSKWEAKKIWLKDFHCGFAQEASCRLSRRIFLSEFMFLGSTIAYANPVRSAQLQEAKDPDVIRYQNLDSGVKFQDIVDGEGQEAREGDFVKVNYVCRRSNGYFVHSTVDQFSGESRPVVLPLDEKEFTVYDQLKHRVLHRQSSKDLSPTGESSPAALSAFAAFVLGAFSKSVATVLTYPAIRCKVMIQASDSDDGDNEVGKSKSPKTFLGALYAIWKKEGILGFFKGLHAQILKTVLASALLLMIKEKISRYTWISMLALQRYLLASRRTIKSA